MITGEGGKEKRRAGKRKQDEGNYKKRRIDERSKERERRKR